MAFAVLPWWFKDMKDAHFLVCFVIVRSHPLTRVEKKKSWSKGNTTRKQFIRKHSIKFLQGFRCRRNNKYPKYWCFSPQLYFTLSFTHSSPPIRATCATLNKYCYEKKKTEEQSYRFYGNWKGPRREESRWNRQAAAKLGFQFCQFRPISGSEIGERERGPAGNRKRRGLSIVNKMCATSSW